MDLLERLLGERIEARDTAMAGKEAEAELHGQCKHPEEIGDVRRTMKRRQASNIALLATLCTVLTLVVGVAVYAATINTNVAHLQTEAARTTRALEKEAKAREDEDRIQRRDAAETTRAQAETNRELTATTIEIKTYLKVLSEDRRRRR